MALGRRIGRSKGRGAQSFIWPGFVDGLATLLVVIIFVLMVSFLVQLSLANRIFGQDTALQQLRLELSQLGILLNLEREEAAALALQRQALEAELADSQDNIAFLETELANTLSRLTESQADRAILQQRLADAATQQETLTEEFTQQLAASQREILQLTAASLALKARLDELQALLDAKTEEARAANETSVNLARQLNDALSSKVVELTRFRSEFFGRLREVLQNRTDISIVGDRFVFQSEVLFGLGSDEIGSDGKVQLDALITALIDISQQIPPDIEWILQIDGHTDDLPFDTDARDNWDLSTDRAMSVVRYFISQGIPPYRLAATGYGEFQPIDPADTPQARAKNRRIEIKLTNRLGLPSTP